MRTETLHFENQEGDRLSARLDRPADEAPVAYALFAHCFTCSKNLRAVGSISRALNRQGIAVLRFDFTGLGASEGEFAETNFTSNVEDLVAAAGYLNEHYEAPALLVGHSLGGAAVLQAAGRLDSVRAVATIAAPADPEHVTRLLEDTVDEIEERGAATARLAGRSFTIKKQFLDDLEDQRMHESIRDLGAALLVFHSPIDQIVGIENAERIFRRARHPKSYVSLDQADHLLSNEDDAAYAGDVMGAWARKYVGIHQEELKQGAPDDNRLVARTPPDTFRTDMVVNGFSLVADEPRSVGGTNLGPTPYDYLLAALGSCTTMTLRMYADRKKWPLEEAVVRLRHQKIHAEDCSHCESEEGKIDSIEREVELRGDLDQPQRERMLEIANRCPVHRTLHSDIDVVSKLIEDDPSD